MLSIAIALESLSVVVYIGRTQYQNGTELFVQISRCSQLNISRKAEKLTTHSNQHLSFSHYFEHIHLHVASAAHCEYRSRIEQPKLQ